MIKEYPYISFLMSYRGRPETDGSIERMFDSLTHHYGEKDFELLIRMDSDDTHGLRIIETLKKKYKNYIIKTFVHNRWEGRWSINYDYQYLFMHINPMSFWLGFITDDIIFTRSIYPAALESESKYIIGDFQTDMTREKLNKVEDLRNLDWLTPEYICAYPLVRVDLIEAMSGTFGYQVNIDSTLAYLNVAVYQMSKNILAHHIKPFIERYNIDRTDNYGNDFNKKWLVTDSDMPSDDRFHYLMILLANNIVKYCEKT